MKVSLRRHTEKGFATYLVIIIIVIMGILLAGLLPFSTTVTQSAAYTKNALQAQYIAEAGAKRAIAALSSGNAVPWLDKEVKNVDGSTDTTSYTVEVTSSPNGWSKDSTPVNGTYKIASTGNYGNFSKKVTVEVKVASGTVPSLKDNTFIVGKDITTSNNNTWLKSNGKVITGGTVSDALQLDGNIKTQPGYLSEKQDISIPGINKSLGDNASPFKIPTGDNEHRQLANGIYYSSTDVDFTKNATGISGPTKDGEFAVVLIDGNLTISADPFHIGGNVVFLVTGSFTLNSMGADFSRGLIYCQNAYINQSRGNFTCQMVVQQNMQLNATLGNSNPCTFTGLEDFLKKAVVSAGATVSNWAKGN